jgi:hypothetical protein
MSPAPAGVQLAGVGGDVAADPVRRARAAGVHHYLAATSTCSQSSATIAPASISLRSQDVRRVRPADRPALAWPTAYPGAGSSDPASACSASPAVPLPPRHQQAGVLDACLQHAPARQAPPYPVEIGALLLVGPTIGEQRIQPVDQVVEVAA